MCAKQVTRKPASQVETTGHSWDGIEEFNNPMPRWWVWTFYACILWAVGYMVAYPAWPLINGATPGVLGASTRADVAAEIERFDAANAGIKAQLIAAPLAAVPTDQTLMAYAEPAGGAVFRTYCAQCHGSGAAGVEGKGYPSLLDDDWLWGGTIEDIHLTITHGIRNTTDPDARYSEMPKFGVDGLLDRRRSMRRWSMCWPFPGRSMMRRWLRKGRWSLPTIAPPAMAMRGSATGRRARRT